MVLYLLFKAISTGVMLVAAVLWLFEFDGPLLTIAAPALSLVFITLTAVVLIVDLERPERFYYILTRSNWRSWMVWGAYFLTAHGAISTVWLAAGWFGFDEIIAALTIPTLVVGVLATSYTGFLFAQGLGRDLWQGPSAAMDLIAQSAVAGAASLLVCAVLMGNAGDIVPLLGRTLAVGIGAHLVILLFEHLLRRA
jgi:formate-dependent nitrite reductase membrane component NrfD